MPPEPNLQEFFLNFLFQGGGWMGAKITLDPQSTHPPQNKRCGNFMKCIDLLQKRNSYSKGVGGGYTSTFRPPNQPTQPRTKDVEIFIKCMGQLLKGGGWVTHFALFTRKVFHMKLFQLEYYMSVRYKCAGIISQF